MKTKNLWFAAIAGLLILGCAEKEASTYPWITDASIQVDANGKMVGYEFFAKW